MDTILSVAATPSQCGPGSDDNEEVLHIPHASPLLEFHRQMIIYHNCDTRCWEGIL